MKIGLQITTTSLLGLALIGLALFWPAGTFDYWQAWVFLGIFVVLSVIYTVYVGVKNPEVLRRRMNAGPTHESRPVQKVVSSGVVLTFFALLVVSGFDHRFGWSNVPTTVALVGNVLAAVGLLITMVVVVQNSYAAANITVEADQTVVSTGLYGLVRHPMYFGGLVMLIGMPFALGSYWAVVIVLVDLVLLAARILDEEKALTEELTGYREYTQKVHSRLVPHVW
ncbi:MAG TPA: isoprenylcysteine carboxylmethyltransferase family protein [Mycobacterium sp.]|jgi:protein-S-isoprenylcysteine O-methyltransferase Ste14|nr:isoprenylcysteine carboxylmethyltransferase family protein [Mycobacterium sp.]